MYWSNDAETSVMHVFLQAAVKQALNGMIGQIERDSRQLERQASRHDRAIQVRCQSAHCTLRNRTKNSVMHGFLIQTLIFNFIPNVGSMIAMVLPLSVIIVDSDLTGLEKLMAFAIPGAIQACEYDACGILNHA